MAGNEKVKISKEELIDLYLNKQLHQWQIAKIFDCDQSTIHYKLRKAEITTRTRGGGNSTNHPANKFVICKYIDKNKLFGLRYVIEVSSYRLEFKDKILDICEFYSRRLYKKVRTINQNGHFYKRFVVKFRDKNPFPDSFFETLKHDLEVEIV